MINIKNGLLVVVSLLLGTGLFAQEAIPGFEFEEIRNIMETYRQATDLSFDVQFSYADSAMPAGIIEQITGDYKMKGSKYRSVIDQTEIIQGSVYRIMVFHDDSVIVVGNARPYSDVMQLPLGDSLFRAQNLDSMRVKQFNDTTRKLQMYFNPASRYSGYDLIYNPYSYLLYSIDYFAKVPVGDDEPGSGVSLIRVEFGNYSNAVIDDSFFDENKFIYKEGETFLARQAYEGYQIMVNVH